MPSTLVPLPVPLHAATHVRASVLLVSMQGVKTHGLIAEYRRHLPESAHTEMLSLAGSAWAPIDLALAHYRACDKLPLTIADRIAIGSYAAARLQEGFLKLVVRISREAGATAWTALAKTREFTQQSWKGSGIAVRKVGPKDAYLEWNEQPCFATNQFTFGFVGLVTALLELYSPKAIVRVDSASRRDSSCGYELSWV